MVVINPKNNAPFTIIFNHFFFIIIKLIMYTTHSKKEDNIASEGNMQVI